MLLSQGALLVSPRRLLKIAVTIGPATTVLHRAGPAKYQLLFPAVQRRRPGPQGTSEELIAMILEMKRCNCSASQQSTAGMNTSGSWRDSRAGMIDAIAERLL